MELYKYTIIFGILSVISTSAFANVDLFLARMFDPDSPSVSNDLRRASHAVGSMAFAVGNFGVEFPDRLMEASVRTSYLDGTPKEDPVTMQDSLRALGINMTWKSGDGSWHLVVSPTQESILAGLKKGLNLQSDQIRWREDMSETTRRLVPDKRDTPGEGQCTGFLIGPSYVMTNHHCVSTDEKCGIIAFRFNEEKANDGSLKSISAYNCKRLIVADQELDFAIVEVEGEPGKQWGTVSLSSREPEGPNQECHWKWFRRECKPILGESVSVVGHPAQHDPYPEGKKFRTIKKISQSCNVTGITSSTEIRYNSAIEFGFQWNFDVERLVSHLELEIKPILWRDFSSDCASTGGSSGSPVFDKDLHVIGILHTGGGFWTNNPDAAPSSGIVPMSEIASRYSSLFSSLGVAFEK